jgi:hypothetical protein
VICPSHGGCITALKSESAPVTRISHKRSSPLPLPGSQPQGTATTTPTLAAPGLRFINRPGPAREVKLQARVQLVPLQARPACSKQHAPVRVLRSCLRERPASQVHRPRPGSACNIYARSPLHRVLRPSIGRPRSGAQVTSSGSLAPLWPCPPAQSNAPSPGSTLPLQGTARPVRFIGPAPGRPATLLSAAPGSTVLNRPAPLGSSGY